MACSLEFGESIGVLAFFLKSREKAYLVPALFFTASASESRFRAIASLGAHDESRVVPETCGVTHFDCWLSETGGLSGYSVVAASEGNFDVAERIFDRVRKPRFLASCASHGPPHRRSCLFTLYQLLNFDFLSARERLHPTTTMAPRSYSKTYKVPRRPFESARLLVLSNGH